MSNTTTIQILPSALYVSAKNNAFPKLREIMAARMLFEQDMDKSAPHYAPRVSFNRITEAQS